jgi:hypothetical protein
VDAGCLKTHPKALLTRADAPLETAPEARDVNAFAQVGRTALSGH